MESEKTSLIAAGATSRVFVPRDGSLGATWTGVDFDDMGWREGPTAVGYGVRADAVKTDVQTDLQAVNTTIYVRIPFEVADPSLVGFMALRMSYDDGFVAYLNGEEVGRGNAPATVAWNTRSSNRAHDANLVEQFDVSSKLGRLRPGKNVLAIQGLNRTVTDATFFLLPELESGRVSKLFPDAPLYFPIATPGKPNNDGVPQMAPRPTFNEESQAFTEAKDIVVSTPLEGASIRYTTNGSRPTETSTLYAAPIRVTGTTMVTARVFKDGYLPGIAETRVWTVLAANLKDFKTNLPIVLVCGLGKAVAGNCGEGLYTPGVMLVLEPGGDGITRITDHPRLVSQAGFRRRGSSTCGYEKFAFNVNLWDEEKLPSPAEVLGFPEDAHFIMHGSNNFDSSMMHNPLAYWMSRQAGRWAARTRWVEAFYQPLNGAMSYAQYFGIYAWMERIRQSPARVDIEELNLTDNQDEKIGGGYILKRDRLASDEIAISAGGYSLGLVDPDAPSSQQRAYISAYITKAVASLSPNIGSQDDSDSIDVLAWIDHHLLSWYPKNVDAFRLSGFMFKSRNGLFEMGPVWDFDRSMGGPSDDRSRTPEGWDNDQVGDGGTDYFQSGAGVGSWYGTLFGNQPPAQENTPWNRAYRARWRELRRGPLSTDNINAQIDEWTEELREAVPRNLVRWSSLAPRYGSYQGEVNHLKDWLATRAAWIDSQFTPVPYFSHKGGVVEKGLLLEILLDSNDGKIYYTLDGTDPKSSGAQPSPSAIRYENPIAITNNVKVGARALDSGGIWSVLVKDTFLTAIPKLMITEFMYNPPPPTAQEDPTGTLNASKMEFIELKNVGEAPIGLAGFRFSRGVTFLFSTGSSIDHVDPGQALVLVSDAKAFEARYGTQGILVAGQYTGALSDAAGRITFLGPVDEVIFDLTYSSSWHSTTAGGGYSLVNVDPLVPADGISSAARWRPSLRPLGTPGTEEVPLTYQRPGDLTQDGRLNVSDAIGLILHLAGVASAKYPCDGGQTDSQANVGLLDWNGDLEVNFADPVTGLGYLFLGGPAHALGTACVPLGNCPDTCK